ncbi:MAG: hypothetical protein ABSA05_14945 [Opitutaceae bacterium]
MNRTPADRSWILFQIAAGAVALLLSACQTTEGSAELRQQRDAIQRRLAQPSEAEDWDAARFVLLNRELGEAPHSLDFFDTLAPDNPARIFLARQLVREFVEKGRYSDALLGWDERYVNRLINSGLRDATQPNPGLADGRDRHLLLQLADFFEVLAGAGDLADAQSLAGRISDLDRSPATLELLRTRSARAGHPELPAVRNRALAVIVVKPVSKLTKFRHEMEDPRSRAATAARAKGQLDGFYGLLFKELDLPADRLDRLKDLLVLRQYAVFDSGEAATARGQTLQNFPEAFRATVDVGVQKVDSEIAALLGPGNYSQYSDYNSRFPRWLTANQLVDSLRSTPAPLTLGQAVQLVDALAASKIENTVPETLNITAGSGQFPAPFPTRPDAGVREKAAGFLSAPQLAALHRLEQRQEIEWDETERVEPADPPPAAGV